MRIRLPFAGVDPLFGHWYGLSITFDDDLTPVWALRRLLYKIYTNIRKVTIPLTELMVY